MLKVLVIGPESLSGELGHTVLARPDVERVHVEQEDDALAAALREHPTLAVIDLPRPRAVGLVRRLRADAATRPCALVWLNRSDPPDTEPELLAAGANAVVPLPIDLLLWDRRLEELMSVPARRSHRIPARISEWSRFLHGKDEADATVLNIGARGVLLETAQPLELGSKLGLSFRLPGDPVDVGVVGQVVRIAEGDEGSFRHGVEFLIYRADARERIALFVCQDTGPERPGAPLDALSTTVRAFGESREWEEELRASELRKALILDSALDCIVTADHEGRVIEFNAAARRLFGYSRAEIIGREVADTLVPPAWRDAMRRMLSDFAQTGESEDVGRARETVAMRSDRSLVPVRVAVFPAYVKGRLLLTAYVRDLSEQHKAARLAAARQRATQALTASLSLAEAAPAVLEGVAQGLDCREARLWVLEGEPQRLLLAGSSGGAVAEGAQVEESALAREACDGGEACWREGGGDGGAGVALAVPVRAGGQALGALEVRCPSARVRDEDWVATLDDIASQLSLFLKRQRAEADLQRFARYDSLTGLPNRSFFLETLERTLSRAGRTRSRLALLFLDLDGFKGVNDGLGHAAGDVVLHQMAERLRAGTRSSDLVARIGGDEFTVLVQNLSRADDAALVARGLLDRLARPCSVDDNNEVTLGASAGISVYPEDGTDADTLLRHADLAMYRAKQEGRNTYRFFTAQMSERALERMLLLDSLKAALERDEFELVYLPVVQERQVTALEALLRWRHPKLGLVAPAAFIAQAEESGLILPIGTRVLKMATRFVVGLPFPDLRLCVNLSARQFLQANLVETVRQSLETSGLAPARLELDLTESVAMLESEEASERLRRLRELGVQLALDDFGTGYFSIGRLRELGFRRLKVDRSLVGALPASAEKAAQVEAILALARALGLEAVAEGVETEAQREFLRARGCTSLQGYLLSPPLAAVDVPGFLARSQA